jgi:hypothetical protein
VSRSLIARVSSVTEMFLATASCDTICNVRPSRAWADTSDRSSVTLFLRIERTGYSSGGAVTS